MFALFIFLAVKFGRKARSAAHSAPGLWQRRNKVQEKIDCECKTEKVDDITCLFVGALKKSLCTERRHSVAESLCFRVFVDKDFACRNQSRAMTLCYDEYCDAAFSAISAYSLLVCANIFSGKF